MSIKTIHMLAELRKIQLTKTEAMIVDLLEEVLAKRSNAVQNVDWAAVDFSRSARVLAIECGVSVGTIYRQRNLRRIRGRVRRINWDAVDLTRSVTDLATELSCSRTRIYAMRKEFSIPSRYKKHVRKDAL
jgi:peptidoglycan hydrolase-like amidase